MMPIIIYFALWFFVWCGLCWPLSRQDIVIGILASLFTAYMTVDLAAQLDGRKSARKYGVIDNFKRAIWFLRYMAIFLWECVKGNVDVAYRVSHPDLPIRPGIVKVKVDLKSDLGLTFLANSITLTPGTTSVDVDKENGCLYIHWIYVRDEYLRGGMKLPVVAKFENILKRVFE